MDGAILVVSSKLRPPFVSENTVQRSRLAEALRLITRRRLTLVCAGAGYGKTTLLADATSLLTPVVWYSLSHSDKDLDVFVTYLVEGIRQHSPGFGNQVLPLLTEKAVTNASPEAIAGHLVNALGEIDGPQLVVVLDDFHCVDYSQPIRKLVDYLLVHLPANVHLVIATRRPPRLPSLPRLRMIGAVNEIREEELRFTSDEARGLFSQVHGVCPSEEFLRLVIEQTEGWVIGLQLADPSLRVQQGKGPASPPVEFGANKGQLFDYFAEEVVRHESANVQKFLYESSVLSTLSAESCDAIFGRTDSAVLLEHIEQNNLFLVKLQEGCWRYQHLFRDFVRQQASKKSGYLKDLHRRAGAYFEGREDHVQSIQHYLAGADYLNAVRLISKVGQSMLIATRFDTLTLWIGQIPERDLEEAPDLLLLQGRVFNAQGHYDRALQCLEQAMQAYALKKDTVGLSKVLRAKAYVADWRLGRHTEADALYREALELLGPENKVERACLLRGLALSHLFQGDLSAAEEKYEQALKICEEVGDLEGTLAALIALGAWIYWWRGNFSEGLASLQRALSLAEQLDRKYWLAECLSNMSAMLRFLGRCEEAKDYADKSLALSREIGSVAIESWSMACAGMAHDGRRLPDLTAAKRYLQEAARLAERTGNERVRIRTLSSQVLVLLRLDEVAEAIQVANRALVLAEASTDKLMIAVARMHAGAALMNENDERAQVLLLQAREDFQRYDDKFDLTRVNLWIAASYAHAKPLESLGYFKAGLELARMNGYDFWLLEEHRVTVPLLVFAICHDVRREYCRRLLKDVGPEAVSSLALLLDHVDPAVRRVAAEQIRQVRGAEEAPGSILVPSVIDALAENVGVIRRPLDPDEDLTPLRICCFGKFQVYVGDRLVQEWEWQRKTVKSLLKYLAAARGHVVSREEVLESFWGDLEPEAAKSRLWKALYLLRRILEPQAKSYHSSYIVSGQGLLVLRREVIESIDTDEFMRHVSAGQKAETLDDLERALREYEAAELLYAGEFLADDPYEDWTTSERERYRNLYVTILEKLARWQGDKHDYKSAAAYAQRLLAEDRSREDVTVMLMRCLARMGRRREALEQYAVCRKTLKEDLDLEPAPETQILYSKLLAGEAI